MKTLKLFLAVLALCLTATAGIFAQGQQPPPPDAPKSASFPPVATRKLKNGLRVLVVEDRANPIVAVTLVVESGAGAANVAPGVAAFTARMLDQGTTTRSAHDIATQIDFVGGTLGASADYDATRVSSTVLKQHRELAFELVADLSQRPAFKPEEIDRQREQLQGELQVSYGTPRFLADVAFRRVVLGDGPFGLPTDGTPDTAKAITREQIVAFHQTHFIPNNAFLVVGGDIAPADAVALAEKHFGTWKAGKPVGRSGPKAAGTGTARIVVIDKPGAAQTEVRVGQPTILRRDPLYFPGLVMNSVLGDGFSARLNKEIRIKRGLSYGAYSRFGAGKMVGLFWAGCATKSASTKEVVDVILGEVKRLQSEAPATDELTTRKATLTGGFVQGLQSVNGMVGQVATATVLGLDVASLNRFTTNVAGVTNAQVQAFAKQKLDAATPTIVLVGDASVFGAELKKAYGEFTTIKLDDFDPVRASMTKAGK